WPGEHGEIAVEGDELAQGHGAEQHLAPAEPEHDGGGDAGHDLHERPENSPERRQPQVFRPVVGADLLEAANLVFFLRVGLHDADAGEIFQHVGAHRAQLRLGVARPAKNLPAEKTHDDRDQRQRQHRPEGQPGVDRNHQGQAEKNHDNGIDDRQRAETHQLAHGLNVVGEARHQIAGFGMLKKAQRQGLQVREDPVAQIGLAAPREAVDIDAPAVAEKTLKGGGAKNQQRILDQRAPPASAVERGVDAALDEPGQRDAGEIRGDEREDAQDEKTPIAVDEKFYALIVVKNRRVLLD